MAQLDPKKIRQAMIMGNAVLVKGILVVAGGWGGAKLDAAWGCSPLFMILGLSLGIGLGLWYILLTAKRFSAPRHPEE